MSLPAATLAHVTSHPGLFVSFEGGDGAGKSTQARLLGDWLTGLGREVVLTREPGGTELGLLLRDAVLHGDHVDARTEALLYATDRAHHVASLVRPALDRGAVVVTDRYLDSSVAYQGSGRDLGPTRSSASRCGLSTVCSRPSPCCWTSTRSRARPG